MLSAKVIPGIVCQEDDGVVFELAEIQGKHGACFNWRVMVDGHQAGQGSSGCAWSCVRQCFLWYESWKVRTPDRIRHHIPEPAPQAGGSVPVGG